MNKENNTPGNAQNPGNNSENINNRENINKNISDGKRRSRKPGDKKKIIIPFLFLCIAVFFMIYNPSHPDKVYQKAEGLTFGTEFHITYYHPENKELTASIHNALQVIDESLSMFNKNSLLYRINQGEIIEADSLFRKVWTKGAEISRATDGAFDMTIAPLVNAWGFGLNNRSNMDSTMVDSLLQYIGWNKVSWTGNYPALPEGMKIDAGAIAKGLGCDIVADTLLANGASDFCIEIGGEIFTYGLNDKGKKWRIGINKPEDDSLAVNKTIYKIVELSGCGMATSGNYRRFYVKDGIKYSHTIDPRTGWPVNHSLLSATIIAPDCMTADGWATACMVAGLEKAQQYINENNIQGLLIYEENGELKCWYSKDFPIVE